MKLLLNTTYPIASRATDPESSHEAECEITDNGGRDKQCQAVLEAVRQSPGSTAVELSAMYHLDRYAVSRRTSDLESKGLIVKGERRKCGYNNRMMVTWNAVIESDPSQWNLFLK